MAVYDHSADGRKEEEGLNERIRDCSGDEGEGGRR